MAKDKGTEKQKSTWGWRETSSFFATTTVGLGAWVFASGAASEWAGGAMLGAFGGCALGSWAAFSTGVRPIVLAGLPALMACAGAWLVGGAGGETSASVGAVLGAATAPWAAAVAWREKAVESAEKEAEAAALEARMRPHFVFNALNAIAALAGKGEKEKTEEAALDLADLLRVFMRRNPGTTTLGDELTVCRRYEALERLRFGERLEVEWKISEGVSGAVVPWLSVQPMIENAIVHGVEKAGRGKVSVEIFEKNGRLVISVENPMPKEKGAAGNAMGTENLRKRLLLLFGESASLRGGEMEDGRWRSVLAIPFERRSSEGRVSVGDLNKKF